MNGIYNHYVIDMSSNNNFVQIPIMQGDGNNVRGFEVELISNGTQYRIDKDNTIVSIMGTKPDTCQILNECSVTDAGCILVDITSQMSAVKGRGDYSIVLMDKTTNSQLKSFPFYILTTPAPFNISEIVSGDEFRLLTKTITDAGAAAEDARQEIQNVKNMETEFSANEEIRITNESRRVSSETLRQQNETVRISNESARQSAETDRTEAEEIRADNENMRISNEATRRTAENERTDSEAERMRNEKTRSENELERQENEINRTNTFNTLMETANSEVERLQSENDTASASAESAKQYEASAKSSAETAMTKASEASGHAADAESFAEKSKEYSEEWKGSLLPQGAVLFSELPAENNIAGHLYNISEAFVTDSGFKDGAGYSYPAGTNVFWTSDGKWDCLSGTLTRVLTQAEYDALPHSEKMNGTIYYISDADNLLKPATDTEDGLMSPEDKSKLDGIEAGAEVNVQADWNVSDASDDAFIKNKPSSLPASDVYEWAKAPVKPIYTAGEIGLGNVDNTSDADKPVSIAQQAELNLKAPLASPKLTGTPKAPTASAGTNTTQIATTAFAQTAISDHNSSAAAHSDIRDLISGLTARLNALADSDDTTLDQLSEIVAYIKSNRTLIETVTTDKVNVADIVDSLASTSTNKPLSANQGKALNDLISTLTAAVNTKVDGVKGNAESSYRTGNVNITPANIGLGNVPNVATNNQTPTYTEASALAKLSSGEKLSAAFGKISRAVTDLISHIGDTVRHITSAERADWTAAYTHSQAAHAPSGAEVNQNAFSNVAVGTTTIAADSKTDTLTFAAGLNVTITPDAANDKITIASKDTVYTHPAYTAKSSGLYKVAVDATGHVSAATAVTKADITALGIPSSDTNTHYTSKNTIGSSTATSNTTSALTNGNVYLNSVENGAVTSSHKISGSGTTTVTADANGNIIISSTDTKVTNTLAKTTKAYVTGTTSATTSTGTQVFDTGVYLDTTAGTLAAATFKGALTGNASTATALTTSAGSATVPVYFSGGKPVVCTGIAFLKSLTQAEYNALSNTEKMNGTIYFITDAN